MNRNFTKINVPPIKVTQYTFGSLQYLLMILKIRPSIHDWLCNCVKSYFNSQGEWTKKFTRTSSWSMLINFFTRNNTYIFISYTDKFIPRFVFQIFPCFFN